MTFDRILSTRFLSDESLEQRRAIFIKLRDIVTAARSGKEKSYWENP